MQTITPMFKAVVQAKEDFIVSGTPEGSYFSKGQRGILTGKVGFCIIFNKIELAVEVEKISGLTVFVPPTLLEVV